MCRVCEFPLCNYPAQSQATHSTSLNQAGKRQSTKSPRVRSAGQEGGLQNSAGGAGTALATARGLSPGLHGSISWEL